MQCCFREVPAPIASKKEWTGEKHASRFGGPWWRRAERTTPRRYASAKKRLHIETKFFMGVGPRASDCQKTLLVAGGTCSGSARDFEVSRPAFFNRGLHRNSKSLRLSSRCVRAAAKGERAWRLVVSMAGIKSSKKMEGHLLARPWGLTLRFAPKLTSFLRISMRVSMLPDGSREEQ